MSWIPDTNRGLGPVYPPKRREGGSCVSENPASSVTMG